MYSGAHGHGWSSSSSSASPAPPGTAVAWGGAEVGPTTPAAAEGDEHGQPQPLQPPYEVYAHSYYPQEAHAAYPYAAPPSSSAHFATAHTLPPAIPSGAALGFTPQQSADSQQQHIPSPHLPVYQHSSYSHANIPSAVESARWTGASSSYDDQAGSLRWDAGAAGPGTPAWLAINDQRRWSVASSTDSSASNSRSPIVGGSSVLPFDADEPASPPVEIKAFVQKLYNMLADPDHYQDVLLWNHDGDAFFVAHNERFVNEVLPSAFGHSNIHSFTRQLNVYTFQRMNVAQLRSALDLQGGIAGSYSGWSHPHFRRGDPSTLSLLTPRPSRARLMRKLEKQYGSSASDNNSSSSNSSSAARSPRTVPTAQLLASPTMPPPPLPAIPAPFASPPIAQPHPHFTTAYAPQPAFASAPALTPGPAPASYWPTPGPMDPPPRPP